MYLFILSIYLFKSNYIKIIE